MRCQTAVRAVGAKGKRPLRVGATPVPHAEILDHARAGLAAQGIDLQIEIFESFDEPNELLVAGRLDANYFQYLPFLSEFNRRADADLEPVVAVHIEPFGLYSTSVHRLADLPEYAEVALPADPVNVARSLAMLAELGMIDCGTTQSGDALLSTADIRSNPRRLMLKEISSWLLGDVRIDFDAAFLFGNQAMGLGIDTGTALHCDRGNAAYAEYLVTRSELFGDADVAALAAELNSPAARRFIVDTYRGQVVPAF